MPLLELDDHPLRSDGGFDPLDVAVGGGSAEEGDVDTRLTGELALVCVVVRWVWFEHDVAGSNEIELGVVAGDVKADGASAQGVQALQMKGPRVEVRTRAARQWCRGSGRAPEAWDQRGVS